MVQVTGFNYDDFDPTGVSFPPNGDYILVINGVDEKPSKDGHRMINVHFEVASGAQSKSQFRIGYYIGNPNAEQAKWAFEGLGRLSYGITGVKPTSRGIDFDPLMFKSFNATFDASPNAKGDKFPKIKNLSPYTNAQPQQTNTAPAWGAPQQ